jgi:aldehyde dehydrogenase (NAD+)
MNEEVFGPVLAMTPFRDDDEVLAHGQRHALRPGRGRVDQRPAPRAHHGRAACRPAPCGSTPTARSPSTRPSAATRSSGLGRANGMESVDQYLQTKSVWVEMSEEVQDPFVLRT